jgi:hypothetical protein
MDLSSVVANLKRTEHAKINVPSHAPTLAPSEASDRASVIDSLPNLRTLPVAGHEAVGVIGKGEERQWFGSV